MLGLYIVTLERLVWNVLAGVAGCIPLGRLHLLPCSRLPKCHRSRTGGGNWPDQYYNGHHSQNGLQYR